MSKILKSLHAGSKMLVSSKQSLTFCSPFLVERMTGIWKSDTHKRANARLLSKCPNAIYTCPSCIIMYDNTFNFHPFEKCSVPTWFFFNDVETFRTQFRHDRTHWCKKSNFQSMYNILENMVITKGLHDVWWFLNHCSVCNFFPLIDPNQSINIQLPSLCRSKNGNCTAFFWNFTHFLQWVQL